MKRISLVLAFAVLASDASAISRHDVSKSSCQQVRSILQMEGAAILRYRSKRTNATLYDRFVRSSAFCSGNEYAVATTIPVAGGQPCAVPKCEEIERLFGDD